ncbi:hypothetical protein BGZ96_003146 [Linnemannia gamsii]|uniref:F-box domain-containing protein n=1 Tax=Linnemannia gamsii TaxID=64522 RepID=A0ABQ7JJM2_9FUNG|nr:hypothetical protein BGZ96_003146 [Linnemannia gamsii]
MDSFITFRTAIFNTPSGTMDNTNTSRTAANETACARFFNTPELLDLLTSSLKLVDLTMLVRTNRKLYNSCTPALYKDLRISSHLGQEQTILASLPCLAALGRNAHHVRTLRVGPVELAYMYNCMLAFETVRSLLADKPTTTPPRPLWPPPADHHSRNVVPLALMTNLRRLVLTGVVSSDTHEDEALGGSVYRLPSASDPQTVVAQFCWLIHLNPRLTHLESDYDHILDLPGGRLFANAVAGLSQLSSLRIALYRRRRFQHPVCQDIFYSCRPSLRSFTVTFDEAYSWSDGFKRGDFASDTEWMVESRRQEPLTKLEELQLWDLETLASTSDILAILAHCPNIKKLGFPSLSSRCNHNLIGEFIGLKCSKVRKLSSGVGCAETIVKGPLLFQAMESLPAQTLEDIFFYGSYAASAGQIFTHAILQHSTTMRSIFIEWEGPMERVSIVPILEECINLQDLQIFCHSRRGPWIGYFTTLSDLLERPWNVPKLADFRIGISGCEFPDYPGKQPYRSRPIPIVLSEVERAHFGQLEELYRRIGKLKDLKALDLYTVAISPNGGADQDVIDEVRYFGQLHHKAGGAETGLPDLQHFLEDIAIQNGGSGPFLGR